MTDKKLQSPGRAANAAEPLGERRGLVSKEKTKEIGEHSLLKAGPDGADPNAIARKTTGT